MTVTRMRSRDQARLGLNGRVNDNYRIRGDSIEVLVDGAFLDGNPEQIVDTARPGDLVTIWSGAQLAPLHSLGLADVHPALRLSGFVSAPSLITPDYRGAVAVLFRCEREIDLLALPYLLKVYTVGAVSREPALELGEVDQFEDTEDELTRDEDDNDD